MTAGGDGARPTQSVAMVVDPFTGINGGADQPTIALMARKRHFRVEPAAPEHAQLDLGLAQ